MRKRLIEKFTKSKKGSLGYTLTELLVVIGIIAIVCAIAIPSVIAISRSLRFKQANDYAKSIFLAAQQNLTDMRAQGGLYSLATKAASEPLRLNNSFPGEYKNEYFVTSNTQSSFLMVLPTGSVDASLLSDQVIVEYNPYTGNVYSVFYCAKKDVQLLDAYQKTENIRDKAVRKAMLIGYYDGSGLNSAQIELEDTAAQVEFLNEQEGIVRITIPMPDAFYSTFSFQDFVEALRIKLTITGEMELRNGGVQTQSLANAEGASVGTERAVSFDLPTQSEKNSMYSVSVDGRSVVVEYPIDSLVDYGSFANLALKTSQIGETQQYGIKANQKRVSEITNEADFVILPGENVTIQADVEFEQSKNIMVNIRSGILSGVNPMFEYLQPSGTEGKYVLGVANGRNLQNLNALAPSIAKNVESVVFTSDIYWNETVSYYNKEYGSGGNYKNDEEEAPVRALPYFVPIHNESLFGTASFNYAGTSNRTPVLSDGEDSAEHASIVGNVVVDGETARGARVYYLNIDATKYALGKKYYVDQSYTTGMDRDFAGLFGYVNTTIDNIHVVNPIVKGKAFTEDNNPATGALVGAAGKNVYIANCSTYIDKEEKNFNSAMMRQEYYNAENAQGWYGVSGEGAVGGLVGYAKSHRTTNGALSDNQKVLAFNSCFAAVNVSGNLREEKELYTIFFISYFGYDKDYGYSNGIGGLIGHSELTNFYNCYASGNVISKNANGRKSALQTISNGLGITAEFLYTARESAGAGGFVGTSHGTRYTNCFATGNVSTESSSAKVGAGGFVGVMCIDESFDYGTKDDANISIAQYSIFNNCYCVGTITVDNKKESNFSGANARVKLKFSDLTSGGALEKIGRYAVSDYYRLLPPHYYDNRNASVEAAKFPDYQDFYIYKDSYYLSGFYNKEGEEERVKNNPNNCADPIAYHDLVALKYGSSAEFLDAKLDQIKKMKLGQETYKKLYFSTPGIEKACRDELSKAFVGGWGAATEENTHGYERTGAYPFPIRSSLPYYGSWPLPIADAGIGYYEIYANSNANGSASNSTSSETKHYYFDREATSQLSNDPEDIVVDDGYVIFSASDEPMYVTINKTIKVDHDTKSRFETEFVSYYVFLLTDEVMQAATKYTEEHPDQFYVPVTVKQGESNYTFHFNPNVARSQLFEGEAQPEDGKPAQNRFYIRSARQFAALEKMSSFWGADYVYEQQLNLDATQYNWSEKDESVAVSSIGNVDAPFAATYAASYMDANSNSAKYEIKGMTPKDAGFFGVIGENGTVRDVIISCPAVTAKPDVDSAAVLAGENQGTISGVELILGGDVQITAQENAGILAGKTSGSITDCKVTEEKNQRVNVTLEAKYVGGLVGTAAGTEQNTISLDQCSLELTGALELKGTEAAGGFVGAASKVTADTVGVSAKSLTSSAKLVGGLMGNAEDTTITSGVLNLTNELAATDEASVAGGAAAQTSGSSFTGVQVTLNSLSGGSAAGFAYTAEDVKLDNCQVSLTGGISGTNGAAGVVGETSGTGSLRAVNGKLGTDVTSAKGQAAGFALNLKAGTTVQSCTVALNNTDISASKKAAGFAISVGESVDGSSVRGKGSVSGTDAEAEAAGYAIDIAANVSNSYVTPAVADGDYQGNCNDNLTISGTNAAGFALRVGKGKTVNNCYTLGTIKGEQVYGFAGRNGGTISKSIANVDLYGTKQAAAFVGSNEGSVTTSYGWYDDNGATALTAMGGKCVNSYFANLDSLLIAKESVTVYGADGTGTNVKPETLRGMKLDGFKNPGVLNAYPYEADLYENGKASYPYPMLRDHYGDWITPPQYAYGVAYYEIYDDDSFKLHLVDLSDQEKTVEGKNFSEKKGDFDHTGTIMDAGYAVFRQESDSKLDNYCGAKIDGLKHSSTINEATINYSFFKLNAKDEATVAGKKTVKVDTRFADAFGVTDGIYQVRTAEQLANIGEVTASFNQTHDIVTTDFATAAIASGKTYDGHGWKLTVTDQTQKWLNVSGTVQNLNLEVLASNGTAVFGTVGGNVSLNAVTMGQAASAQPQEAAAQAQTDNTSGTTAPTTPAMPKFALAETVNGSLDVVSVTVNGDVGTFIGGNAANVTINGATEVTGNVGTLVAGGTVQAKDITVDGNVTGGLIETTVGFTAGNVTVNGALNGKLVGTASGTVSLGTVTVGSIGETGALIGTAGKTATIGNITVNDALSGKLVDVVAGTVSGAEVSAANAQDINSLFGEVQKDAKVENFNITVDSMAAPLVGGELKGALKGVTVKAGTVSGAQGVLAATSSGTIEGCGVNVTAVTVSTDVFGGLVGKVTGGSLTGNTVNAGTITYTLGDKGVSIGGLVGEMSGGTLGDTSKATTVSGSIEVVVPEQTQNAQAVAVEEESSAAAEAAAEEGAEALDVKQPVYAIGGAVGKIIAGEDAEATIRNVSAAVKISATEQNGATIGSFLGYAGAGTLEKCASTEDSSYEFLGDYAKTTKNVDGELWQASVKMENPFNFYSDDAVDGAYDLDGEKLKKVGDGATVHYVVVDLTDCTCVYNGKDCNVEYGVDTYYYGMTEELQNKYTAEKTAEKGKAVKEKKRYYSDQTGPTGYYHLEKGTFYQVTVKYNPGVWVFGSTFSVLETGNESHEFYKKDVSPDKHGRLYAEFELYELTNASLDSETTYLAVKANSSDETEMGVASELPKEAFEQRDALYSCLWTVKDKKLRNVKDEKDWIVESEMALTEDLTMQYKKDSVTFNLYPVTKVKAEYTIRTFKLVSDKTDYERQKVVYLAASQEASATSEIAPAGEITGGETQNNG